MLIEEFVNPPRVAFFNLGALSEKVTSRQINVENVIYFLLVINIECLTLYFITFLCYEFSNYFKVPHPPPESPKKCCELFGVPEMCQSLCRSGQSAGYNNEYTIPSCRPYELEIAKCKGKILYDSF